MITKKQYEAALFDNWEYCESEFADKIRQCVLDCLKKMSFKELKNAYENDKRGTMIDVSHYDKDGSELSVEEAQERI